MATFTSLPPELIALIGEFTDPHSHLDLICTCSYIAGALRDIVARHREAAACTAYSDLEPQTIPQLLRRVCTDPIAAYHVRSIQIWGARTCWADWRSIQLEYIEDNEDFFQQGPALEWTFTPGEVEGYLHLAAQYLLCFQKGGPQRPKARDQLTNGDDGLMKALLIALCPRLNNLYYAQGVNCQTEDPEVIRPTSLHWFANMTVSNRDGPIEYWPPGIRSLRHLAIGVETGTWIDQAGDIDRCEPELLAILLNLPNLESLYLRGLSQRDVDGSETYLLSPGSSPLRHLFLDDINQVDTETWSQLMLGCGTQLTSVAFRSGAQDNLNDFVGLAIENCISLQSVMIYSVDGSDLQGYRCNLFLPEVLGGYRSAAELRHLTLSASDLALGVLHWGGKVDYPDPRERLIEYVVPSGRDPPLPLTLELLVIVGDINNLEVFLTDDGKSSTPISDVADWFDDMLAALISARVEDGGSEQDDDEDMHDEDQSGSAHQDSQTLQKSTDLESEPDQQGSDTHEERKDEDDSEQSPYMYPNLKLIYIDPWRLPSQPYGPRLWLQKSIQAAHQRGIEVRTKVNINPRHQDIDFHIPPDRYDIRPGLTPPANELFDPVLGRWVERRCGSCGDCASCHELFVEEAWAGAYKAPPLSDDNTSTSGPDDNQITQEIWSRGLAQIGQSDWAEEYYVQPLEAFRRDRRCEGEIVGGRPEGRALPSLGYPITRRKLLACEAVVGSN